MSCRQLIVLIVLQIMIFMPAAHARDCQGKVEKVIIHTARAMGLKGKFGLKLFSQPAGLDSHNAPLTKYHAGVFLVKSGYLSDSGADVIVRARTCEVIKLSISIGG